MKKSSTLGIISVKGKLENGGWLGLVDLSKLFFADYQREAIPTHVKKIAAGWDDRAANPLKISVRDNRMWCYDGRQTSSAALQTGKISHDAIIFTGLTYEQEARYFFIQNDVPKKMGGWRKFYADMRAGNDALKMIVDTVHKNGLTLPYDPGVHKNAYADVTSTLALLEAFNEGGLVLVDRLCKVLNKAWRENGKSDGNVYEDGKKLDMLRGLIGFLGEQSYSKLPDKTLIEVLKTKPPAEVRALAKNQPAKGRIDATQIKGALYEVFGKEFRYKIAA